MIAEFLNLKSPFWFAAIAFHLWACFRTSRMATQFGRRAWLWFVISLFVTVIPLAILLWIDYIRIKLGKKTLPENDDDECQDADQSTSPSGSTDSPQTSMPLSCPHCHALLTPGMVNSLGAVKTCTKCGLPIREDKLA